MTCGEFEAWLQGRWDGEAAAEPSEWADHLAGCAGCRELHAAADRLESGLRARAGIVPPPDLTARIVRQVLLRRRLEIGRRWAAAAIAAGVLLVAALGYFAVRPGAENTPARLDTRGAHATPLATPEDAGGLGQSVREAGSAVVGLTRRTADETVGQGRLLLPERVPVPRTDPRVVSRALEPPARTLSQAGQVVSSGLEPVTSSARRAVDLFRREIAASLGDQP